MTTDTPKTPRGRKSRAGNYAIYDGEKKIMEVTGLGLKKTGKNSFTVGGVKIQLPRITRITQEIEIK